MNHQANRRPTSVHTVTMMAALALCVTTSLLACKDKTVEALDAATSPDAGAVAAAATTRPVDAGAEAPETPVSALDQHRDQMADAAEAGHFSEVCKGTPWVNQTLCNWVAVRAAGTPAGHPDGEVFRAFFTKEHWKRVSGRIIDDAGDTGDYEVTASGYRHHCILDTDETKFTTKGSFNMWVQEQPETREVTVNSGDTQQWVVLEEATLAKQLWDLAHEGSGLEATALAKNAMGVIARYVSYAERKGTLPAVPGATAPVPAVAKPGPSTTTAPAPPAATPTVPGSAATGMEGCCAALHQAQDLEGPGAAKNGYSGLLVGCELTTNHAPVAARKQQLRDNAAVLNLPPLPPACR